MTQLAAMATEAVQAETALLEFQAGIERSVGELLLLEDEAWIDARWTETLRTVRAFCARPAKRVRPTLLATGWALASGEIGQGVPLEVRGFAAGLELLHAFMLIHDDVADRAAIRRGGPALHVLLGKSRTTAVSGVCGDDLAVVVGDHLYARAIEAMLSCNAPHATAATRYMLGICRHTAAGQFLDLDLSSRNLEAITLFQTLRVANLKTAQYGFVAPLVAGAMLGGAGEALISNLVRAGRQIGVAFQLQDDLLGLFGADSVIGKDGGADYFEGKRTFPLLAAWTRASATGRQELDDVWNNPDRTIARLNRARDLVEQSGGVAVTNRVIDRMIRGARKTVASLDAPASAIALLDDLFRKLSRRSA